MRGRFLAGVLPAAVGAALVFGVVGVRGTLAGDSPTESKPGKESGKEPGKEKKKGKVEIDPQVVYARSWDAAVEEAKLLNAPLVVHSHGFYCGPCWGLHGAILKNKKYVEFAEKNTVEVICLSRLQEGIDKADERAETYETERDGEKVECLVEFPSLTAAEMLALGSSKGASYNNTGGVPYTCLVDPHTLAEVQSWKGGSVSAGSLMEAVTELRKTLAKEHGKGVSRKEVQGLADVERKTTALCAKGEFAAAVAEATKAGAKAADWPEAMSARLTKAREAVVAAAQAELERIEALGAGETAQAKAQLSKLLPRLKGTGLEERAKALLTTWSASAGS